MSGIAGLWNRDGKPADPATLSRMSGALAHRGPDGPGSHSIGAAAFACQHSWVTLEEIGEVQPIVGPGGVMLAMDGRIDNRDELLRSLDLPATTTDAACVLAAYRAWDDEFPQRLNGDFAVALFDARKPQLLLVRDSIGIRPLYYFCSDRLVAFASEIKALFAHPDITAAIDEEGVADYMLIGSRPLARQEITCFSGISAVVPSTVAIVTPSRLTTRRYWDFDTSRTLRFRAHGEYVDAFRERFASAVRRRLRSHRPVAVAVSGGLDSSSILCQAETLRRAGASACPEVYAISYTGAPGTDADEQRYLGEIERTYGIAVERFPVDSHRGLVDGVAEQMGATEAPFIDYIWGVTRELHRRASGRGARVLLSGLWGDQVLFSSAYLVDLFRGLAWRTIRDHFRGYTPFFGAAQTRTLRRRFVMDIARHQLPRAVLRPLKWARLRLVARQRSKSWFSDAFLRRALRSANEPAALGRGIRSAQTKSIYAEARSKYHVQCMECNNKIGALFGLDAAFPFLDRDLLQFLMAVPGEHQNHAGVPRALLRDAMAGVLPDAVRARKWKADFTDVVNAGVAQDRDAIAAALSPASLGVRLGLLDAARLAPEVARLSSKVDAADCVHSWDLADVFGLEVWLRVFLEPAGIASSGGSNDASEDRFAVAR